MADCTICGKMIYPSHQRRIVDGSLVHTECAPRSALIGINVSQSMALLADNPETFFLLWNPESEKPMRMVFTSEVAVWQVADEMARKNPGQKFFVMESKGYSRTDEPVVRHMTLVPGTIQASAEAKLKGRAPSRSKK